MVTGRILHRDDCPRCDGSGICRNGRFFFYAISLIGSAAIMFLQWPPTPALFEALHRLCWSIGLPDWIGSATIWMLTAVPAILGISFFYLWLHRDICPTCEGRGVSAEEAGNPPIESQGRLPVDHGDQRRPEDVNHAIPSSSR
ncbi:MAG: hypothetical protein ACE5EC_03315 [Phycisphaerae bacterium]